MVYILFLILSDLIPTTAYILLVCILLNMSSNLCNRVIMPSPLILWMFSDMVLLSKIIIIFCYLFGRICLIS